MVKISSTGEKTVICGSDRSGFNDGIGSQAKFDRAEGIVYLNDELIVADLSNSLIRKVKLSDKSVTTYAGVLKNSLSKDGLLKDATFNSPTGITIDSKGNIYLTEYLYSNVRKINTTGKVETLAGNNSIGFADGIGNQAIFNNPRGIFSTSNGYLFVTDIGNDAIRLITPKNSVKTIYKSTNNISPQGIVMDSKGNLFIAESKTHSISKLTRK